MRVRLWPSWLLAASHRTLVDAAWCEPSDLRPTDQWNTDVVLPCTPFYLDEETDGFDMSEMHACFEEAAGMAPGGADFSDHITPLKAEHITDLLLLRQLRDHPSRVHDPALATVHFTGITPVTSYYFSGLGHGENIGPISDACKAGSYPSSHDSRMEKAAGGLWRKLSQLRDDDVIVILNGYWDIEDVFRGKMGEVIESEAGRRHILVGISDLYFDRNLFRPSDRPYNISVSEQHVTIPYAANSRIDAAARRGEACDLSRKDASFFFAGNVDRHNHVREPALSAMAEQSSSALVIFRHTQGRAGADTALGHDFKQLSIDWSSRMARARFCLIPSGDTPTTSRLFDALASGCIPIYMGEYIEGDDSIAKVRQSSGQINLPFPSALNWTDLVRFEGSLGCLNADGNAVARALGKILDDLSRLMTSSPHARDAFEAQCRRRVRAYEGAISFFSGSGAASGLLRELYSSARPWPKGPARLMSCPPPPPPPPPLPPPLLPPASTDPLALLSGLLAREVMYNQTTVAMFAIAALLVIGACCVRSAGRREGLARLAEQARSQAPRAARSPAHRRFTDEDERGPHGGSSPGVELPSAVNHREHKEEHTEENAASTRPARAEQGGVPPHL